MGLVMDKYQREPRREDAYLVDYLKANRGKKNKELYVINLLIANYFLFILLLLFYDKLIVFNVCLYVLNVIYVTLFIKNVYTVIDKYKYRPDELSKLIKFFFQEIKDTEAYGGVKTNFLAIFSIVGTFFYFVTLCVVCYYNIMHYGVIFIGNRLLVSLVYGLTLLFSALPLYKVIILIICAIKINRH